MARDYAVASSAARITTTSTSPVDALTLTWTPASASKVYYLLASTVMGNSLIANNFSLELYDATTGVVLGTALRQSKDSTDRIAMTHVYVWTSPSTPVSQSFKLRYYGAGGTIGIAEMTLVALESDAADVSIMSTGLVTTNIGQTYAAAQSLSLTPATAGDYLLIAGCLLAVNSANSGKIRFSVDAAQIQECLPFWSSGGTHPWFAATVMTLSATAHTIEIEFGALSAGVISGAINRAILAIRLDTLRDVASAVTSGRSTTTSTSAVDAVSTSIAATASVDYLAVGSLIEDNTSTSSSGNTQLYRDGAISALHTREGVSTNPKVPYGAFHLGQYSTGSRAFKLQYFSESTNTTGVSDRCIAVLDLRAAIVSTDFLALPGLGAAVAGGQAAALVADLVASSAAGNAPAAGAPATVIVNAAFAGVAGAGTADAAGAHAGLMIDLVAPAGVGAAGASGLAATAQADHVAQAEGGDAVAAGLVPTVLADHVAASVSGRAAADGLAVTVLTGADFAGATGAGDASADGYAPGLAMDFVPAAGIGDAAASGMAAVLAAGQAPGTGSGAALANGEQARLSVDTVFAPSIGVADAAGAEAMLLTDMAGRPAPGDAQADGVAATVAIDAAPATAAGLAVGGGMSARMIADLILAARLGAALADGLPALAIAERGVRVTAGVGAAIAAGFVAGLTLDQIARAAVGAALADGSLAALDVSAIDEILAEIGFELAVSSRATVVPAVSGEVNLTEAVTSAARVTAAVDAAARIVPAVS